MVESSSPTNSALKVMLGIGSASIISIGLMPNFTLKTLTNHPIYAYECTSENSYDYLLKNEVMPKVLSQYDMGSTVEIVHSFVNNLIENSEKSPSQYSKTVDAHFWDLA